MASLRDLFDRACRRYPAADYVHLDAAMIYHRFGSRESSELHFDLWVDEKDGGHRYVVQEATLEALEAALADPVDHDVEV